MIIRDIKLAIKTLRASRWRTGLTILGVVVGVSSVVTIVSIGDGVRQQITRQVGEASQGQITVRPGRLVERDERGRVTSVNYQNVLSSGSLTNSDIDVLTKLKGLDDVVPFGILSGVPDIDGRKYSQAVVIGTNKDLLNVSRHELAFGSMFTANESEKGVAVIGSRVAENLFGEIAPIGKAMTIRGKEVIVKGVLNQLPPYPQDLGIDQNQAIFLPYNFAEDAAGGQLRVYQIIVAPNTALSQPEAVESINKVMLDSHSGSDDFTVLQTADNLAIASNATYLLTSLIASMAGISLLVGGIGIMNIMLVAVSERTYEIGVRKSVGATTHQIRSQFLTEAVLISALGGFVGVIVSLFANYILRLTTSLEPAFNFRLMGVAVVGAVVIGAFFGLMPAIKAARKDPIEALRRTT
jgi:putative ABC transport system permease protein